MREITLDTETTGLDPASGHRIVEIGCVELMGGIKTGEVFHAYLNPEREVPDEAFRVHGLSTQFLSNKPLFADVVEGFLEFIGETRLVIHNAAFDLKFLNAELDWCGRPLIGEAQVLDTVLMARRKFPGSPANLDALCRRFNIDLSKRTHHGALLDAELLAEVYLELTGGRQAAFALQREVESRTDNAAASRTILPSREFPVSEEEAATHEALLAKLKNPLWKQVG